MQQHTYNQHEETGSHPWESVVSEWVDGESEIRPEDLDTPYGRNVWNTYHLIGDALRSEDLAFKPSDMFYARVSRAIDELPPIKAANSLNSKKASFRIAGMAVAAAAVFGLAWVTLPYFLSVNQGGTIMAATETVAPEATPDATLHEYFNAHIAMAGGVPAHQVYYAGALP